MVKMQLITLYFCALKKKKNGYHVGATVQACVCTMHASFTLLAERIYKVYMVIFGITHVFKKIILEKIETYLGRNIYIF